MSEADITNPILVAASRLGARLFRVNTGQGWVGKLVKRSEGTITLAGARVFHSGLVKGGSDIIGVLPVVVTPDMVGKTVGMFVAIEVKYGRTATTKEQAAFVEMVRSMGGVAGVVRSVDEAIELMRAGR